MKAIATIAAAIILLAAPAYADVASALLDTPDNGDSVLESPDGPSEFDTIKNPKRRPKTPRAPSALAGDEVPLPLPLLGVVVVLLGVV